MFDDWVPDSSGGLTLFRVERDVQIDMWRVVPPTRFDKFRSDQVPMWLKCGGLQIEPVMRGRQLAWVRRTTGGWLAVCEVVACSPNGRSHLTMQLWLPPDVVHAIAPTEAAGAADRLDAPAETPAMLDSSVHDAQAPER